MHQEEENKGLKYILYCRRSVKKTDKEEKVASVESQEKEMREIAESKHLKIVKIFKETKSAQEPYVREHFTEMIKMIRAGKANAIICFKMDRLCRNPIDEGELKYLLQKGLIKNIKSSDRDWYPDDNVLLSSVEFGVAAQYSKDLSKHVKRGLRTKIEGGQRPSLAPVGYRNSQYHIRGTEEILVDEERFPIVKRIFEYMLTGQYTPHQLLKIANDDWRLTTRKGKKMGYNNMYKLLTHPFYHGSFEYPRKSGNWFAGKHKPMITETEFNKIQYLLGRPGQAKPKDHIFAYTGLMKCGECGATITCEQKWKKQKNGNVHSYIYYHCTGRVNPNCTQKSIEEKALEKQISYFLSNVEIHPGFHEWALEELKRQHEHEKKDRNTILYKQQKDYDRCVADLDSLYEMKMRQQVDDEYFNRKKSNLEKEKMGLKNLLDGIDKRVDNWLKNAEQTLIFAEKARSEFEKGNLIRKKQILTALGFNHVLKDKILTIKTETPLLMLRKGSDLYKYPSEMLEPAKDVGTKGQNKQMLPNKLLLCGIGESNS
jgi:site-specific DNA recombinase